MIKYSSLIDKPIFSVKEGRQWGRISAVYINVKQFKVVGFALEKIEKFLPFEKVTTFGEASVVFPGGEDLTELKEAGKQKTIIDADKIKGKRVITKKGRDTGFIDVFYFDEETAGITHYEISDGPFSVKKIMSQDGVILLGPDALIVTDAAADVAEKMKSKDEVRSFFGKLSRKTKEFSGKMSKKIKGYRENTEKQMIEIKNSAEKKASQAGDKAGETAESIGKEVKKIKKNAGESIKKISSKSTELPKKKKSPDSREKNSKNQK